MGLMWHVHLCNWLTSLLATPDWTKAFSMQRTTRVPSMSDVWHLPHHCFLVNMEGNLAWDFSTMTGKLSVAWCLSALLASYKTKMVKTLGSEWLFLNSGWDRVSHQLEQPIKSLQWILGIYIWIEYIGIWIEDLVNAHLTLHCLFDLVNAHWKMCGFVWFR